MEQKKRATMQRKSSYGTKRSTTALPATAAKRTAARVSMDAQMKTVIDRTYAKYPGLGTKDVYFIVTAADTNKNALERTVEEFRGFTSCYSGFTEKGIIYGTGAWKIGDIKGSTAMDEAYAMGKGV